MVTIMVLGDYISIREFAEIINVRVQTLRRWIYSGKIPSDRVIKVGGRLYIHRDLLKEKFEKEPEKNLLSLPAVNPRKLFSIYMKIRAGYNIEALKSTFGLSTRRLYDYLRFLISMSIIEEKNRKFSVAKEFDDYYDFFLHVSKMLSNIYADVLELINGETRNYDFITIKLAKQGYNVSPSKIKRLVSILRNFCVIKASEKFSLVKNKNLKDVIYSIIKMHGGIIKIETLEKSFQLDEKVVSAIIDLIRESKIRIRTIPREAIIIAKAIYYALGRNPDEVLLPVTASCELEKVLDALERVFNINRDKGSNIIKFLQKVRSDLLSISRDRPRPEYKGEEPPFIVMMHGPWSPSDVIEVIE